MPWCGCGSRASRVRNRWLVASSAGRWRSIPACRVIKEENEMAKPKIKFLQKPTCTTCRKAKEYLEKLGAELELRSLDADPLSEAELDKLIGTRDYRLF